MTGPWLRLKDGNKRPVLVNMERVRMVYVRGEDTALHFDHAVEQLVVAHTLDELWEMLNDEGAGYLMREPNDFDGKLTSADDDWPVGPAPFQYPDSTK